jgi:hypothetical protein
MRGQDFEADMGWAERAEDEEEVLERGKKEAEVGVEE